MSERATPDDAKGLIGKSLENGLPVIWNFVNELPGDELRAGLPCMIVLSWTYDGTQHGGFPDEATQAAIYRLDESLAPIEDRLTSRRVYSRTGNGLREWVFHASTHEDFMTALNNVLADDERYPIDIKLYSDPDWTDFRRLLQDFGQTRCERMN